MNIKVHSGGKDRTFVADDFRIGQDGVLCIVRNAKIEGGNLAEPEMVIAAYRPTTWEYVEKCMEDAKKGGT